MAISQDFLLELKYKNDIETVLSPYVNLKRRGSNLVGLCPFHNEKTPSFTVYPENGSYYCFGCGAGGDVVTFIRQIENLDYLDAVKLLAERVGMSLPEDGYNDYNEKLKTAVYEINRETARFYNKFLFSEQAKPAQQYLLGRGLSPQIIKSFGLGCAPPEWDRLYKHLKSLGYKDEQLLAADVVTRGRNGKCYDRFRNRVMFPIINLRGNVIGFGGRIMPGDSSPAKYINTADTPVFKKSQNVYALNFAKNNCEKRVILAEGYMDVISLHMAGFTNAVAALGTSFTAEQAQLLSRYTKAVVITLDAVAAGQKATDRALRILSNTGVRTKVLRLPDCKDPDEFIKKHGESRFSALLDGAVNDIEYMLYMAVEGIDTSAEDGKARYLQRATEILADVDDPIARDLYASRLAAQYEVDKSAILLSIERFEKKKKSQKYKQELRTMIQEPSGAGEYKFHPERKLKRRASKAEESILAVLMKHPDYYEYVSAHLPEGGFVTEWGNKAYKALEDILLSGRTFSLSFLNESFTPEEIGFMAMLEVNCPAYVEPKKFLSDCIAVLTEEKDKISAKPAGDLTDEEWAEQMRRIANQKK